MIPLRVTSLTEFFYSLINTHMKNIKLALLLCVISLVYNCKTDNTEKDLAYAIESNTDANGLTYQTVANDPTGLRLYTLDNGLKVYLSKNTDEPKIQTYIAVKAGSNYDPSESTGLAHYLEHMVFKGTAITRGSGKGVIVSIGRETELGRISELVLDAGSQRTPLERRLDKLGERLAGVVAVIAVVIAFAGILAGRETFLAIEVGGKFEVGLFGKAVQYELGLLNRLSGLDRLVEPLPAIGNLNKAFQDERLVLI